MTHNIMIVESDNALRDKINLALPEVAFKVVGCSNYLEALLKLDEFKPDLVILNEELPLVDGWEACYQLHWVLGMPAILIGESSYDEAWIKALEVGADFYLKKPFSSLVLYARVKAILRRYQSDIIYCS